MTKLPLACEELTNTEKPLLPGELPNCQIEHALRREDENLRSLSSYFYTNKIVTYRNKGRNTKKTKQTKKTHQTNKKNAPKQQQCLTEKKYTIDKTVRERGGPGGYCVLERM